MQTQRFSDRSSQSRSIYFPLCQSIRLTQTESQRPDGGLIRNLGARALLLMRGLGSALEPLRTSRRGHQRRATRVSLARIVQQRHAHEPAHGPLESGARHSRDLRGGPREREVHDAYLHVLRRTVTYALIGSDSASALLSAGRPKHTDQGRTNRHARASPLPQLHMRKGVNRNPSRRPDG